MITRFPQIEFDYLLANFPAVGLVGARQVGKTTLAKSQVSDKNPMLYLDLERGSDKAKLGDPELFLQNNADKTIILDEIQNMPELFPLLRSLIDDDRRAGRFVILGSASPPLLRQSSESLAGRIAYLQLHPLNLLETAPETSWQNLWTFGGFPEPLLKNQPKFSERWQQNFLENYLFRDLPFFGLPARPEVTRRLFKMLAAMNGQLLSYSTLAKSLGLTVPTVKTYLEFIQGAFLVRTLQPWSANLKKRLVKSPKIYFSDTGMLHHLLGLHNFNDLLGHPAAGLSWETFVIAQVKSVLKPSDELYFYRTSHGAEIDLLIRRNEKWRAAAEIKLSSAPVLSKGTFSAMEDLELEHLYVVTPEADNYFLKEKVEVVGIELFLRRLVEG